MSQVKKTVNMKDKLAFFLFLTGVCCQQRVRCILDLQPARPASQLFFLLSMQKCINAHVVWIHAEFSWKQDLAKEAESCMSIQMRLNWTCRQAAFLSLSHCCYRVDPQTAGQQTLGDVHILSHYHITGEKRNPQSPNTLLCALQNRHGEKKINR